MRFRSRWLKIAAIVLVVLLIGGSRSYPICIQTTIPPRVGSWYAEAAGCGSVETGRPTCLLARGRLSLRLSSGLVNLCEMRSNPGPKCLL
jgi:hypothetical protein